jgi:N4-gp56 family major capsid protein
MAPTATGISAFNGYDAGQGGNVNVSPATMTLYRKKSFDFLKKDLRFMQLGMNESIGRNAGQTISTWRVDNLAVAKSALGEGSLPTGATATGKTYTATLQQFGNYLIVTDWIDATGRSPILDTLSKQVGYNAGLSLDSVNYDEWIASATAHYAGNYNVGNFAADAYFTSKELRRLAKKFRAKDVRPNDDGFFHTILHPDCEFDILTDDLAGGVLDIRKRASEGDDNLWKGVVAVYGGHKVWTSSLVDTATVNGQTAYRNISTGYGAMLNVKLDSMPYQMYINPTGNISYANPIGQLGTIGWKAAYVADYIGYDGPRAYVAYSTASEPTA